MTNALELKVSKADAREAIQSVLGEISKIRRQYCRLLDDYFAPLDDAKEQYKTQIFRLASLAKEDPDISREFGMLELFLKYERVEKKQTKYFSRIIKEKTAERLKRQFPLITSLSRDSLFDFYQVHRYLSNKGLEVICISEEPGESTNLLSGDYFDDINYWYLKNERRLLIPNYEPDEDEDNDFNNALLKENNLLQNVLFMLLPLSAKVKRSKSVEVFKDILREGSKKVDGILYHFNGNLPKLADNLNSYKCIYVQDFARLIKQFISKEDLSKFLSKKGKFTEDYLKFVFELSGENELEFKCKGMKLTIKNPFKGGKK